MFEKAYIDIITVCRRVYIYTCVFVFRMLNIQLTMYIHSNKLLYIALIYYIYIYM